MAGGDFKHHWVFPDTHLFLHFKSMKAWESTRLVDGKFSIVISMEIVRELDKAKWGSNNKKRKRAQAALSLIEAASSGRSELRFPVIVDTTDPGTMARKRGLDEASADQRLLAVVDEWKQSRPGDRTLLLTGDPALRMMANERDIEIVAPPSDWELHETDPNIVRIRDLESQLEKMRDNRPDLALGCDEQTDRDGTVILIDTPLLPAPAPLTGPRAAELAKETRDTLVRSWRFIPFGQTVRDLAPDKVAELDRYEKEYAKYLIDRREYEQIMALHHTLHFTLTNHGDASAEDIDVFLKVLKGATFLDGEDTLKAPEEPQAPDPPANVFSAMARQMEVFKGLQSRPFDLLLPHVKTRLPNVSGPWIADEGNEVRFHVGRAKHGLTYVLDPVLVRRDEVETEAIIEYSILGADAGVNTSGLIKLQPRIEDDS